MNTKKPSKTTTLKSKSTMTNSKSLQPVAPVSETKANWSIQRQDIDASGLDNTIASASSYPSLQVNTYSPTPNQVVKYALSNESADCLSEQSRYNLDILREMSYYKSGDVEMSVINKDISLVVLKQPIIKAQDKESKKVIDAAQGDYKGGRHVTIAWLLVAIVAGGELVTDSMGNVQPFTIKLMSNKTRIIRNNVKIPSLFDLNSMIQKSVKNGMGKWLTHLVELKIDLGVVRFTSKKDPKLSSFAVDYALNENYVEFLDASNLMKINQLLADPDFVNYYNTSSIGGKVANSIDISPMTLDPQSDGISVNDYAESEMVF